MDLGGAKEDGEAIYTADMNVSADKENVANADGADPYYTAKYYAAGQENADVQDEPRYVETTIAALDALAPTASEERKSEITCASQPIDKGGDTSDFDVMLDKLNVRDTAVIVCRESDIDEAFLTSEPEILILGEQTYLRYAAVSYAEPILDAIRNQLDSDGADYKVVIPENVNSSGVEILILVDAES